MSNREHAFTFALDMARWADELDGRMNQVTRQTFLRMCDLIVERTPVDTGFCRSSFVTAVNGEPPDGEGKPQPGEKGPFPMPDVASGILEAKAGDILSGAFNADYAEALEYGHSQQAPEGMVRLTVAEGPAIVDQVAGEVLAAAWTLR